MLEVKSPHTIFLIYFFEMLYNRLFLLDFNLVYSGKLLGCLSFGTTTEYVLQRKQFVC